VQLIEVQVVGAQPPQAGVDRVEQVFAAETPPVRPAAEPDLGRHDDVVPRASLQPAADDLLRPALAVAVRGVDEGAAGLGEAVQQPMALRLADLPPERHGAQTQPADPQPGLPERNVLHAADATSWSALQIKAHRRAFTNVT
jgi:hypothetical protein